METKEYTPEEIAALEAKAAKYDKAQKRKRKFIIGGGVLAGFFIAGAISSMAAENSEDTSSDETSEDSEDIVIEGDVVIESSEPEDVDVKTETIEI